MDGHVRHLHCHYRVLGGRDTAPQISYRLNRVVQDDLLKAYEQAMDEVMGDDPSVIVIRTLHSRIALALREHPNDGQLSRRWGERLAGSVVRRLAASADGDEEVIRFDNQAEYVAAYIVDVIDDRADDRWYYGAFVALRGQPREQRISQVLMDNREHLGETLGQLYRRGYLTQVFALLDDAVLRRLWEQGVRLKSIADEYKALIHDAQSLDDPSRVRPANEFILHEVTDSDNESSEPDAAGPDKDRQLFALVLSLVERLGIRGRVHLTEAQLFDRYRPQGIVDWRDRAALTQAVCDILDFLSAQGVLQRFDVRIPPTTLMTLDETLKDFDWLEAGQLQARLLNLLGGQETQAHAVERSLTPRQRELIDALSNILMDTRNMTTVASFQKSEAMALFLYSLLTGYQAHWRDDDLAKRLIEALARTHIALSEHKDVVRLRSLLIRGDAQPVFNELARTTLRHSSESADLLNALGKPALQLLQSLASDTVELPGGKPIETRCAGVFLLLRAVSDLRLPALVGSTAYPSLEALLIPMLMRLAGEGAVRGDRIDSGLAVLSGADEAFDIPALVEVWQGVSEKDHADFQYAMLSVLAGQRVVRGTHLHLCTVKLDDGRRLMIGGDAAAQVWPLARIVDDAVDIGKILAQWNHAWTQSCGRTPEYWVVDASLAAMDLQNLDRQSWVIVPDHEMGMESENMDVRITDHYKGRDEVLLAFRALSSQRLGLICTDLQMALIGMVVVRLWARWLKQFSNAGVAYLLDRMIRRGGTLTVDASAIEVELESAPLDVVIEMAGYTRALERLPWLGDRSVSYRIRR